MRLASTIIAVLLAAAGVSTMLYTARHDTGRGGVAGPKRLFQPADLPVDEVDRITIARASETPLVFQRTGPDWSQVQPFAHPMDPFSIRQMAVAARELEVVDRIPPDALGSDQSLATLQLAPPASEITYQWPGGSMTLELGRRSVAGRAYLRRKGDDAVCIVNQKLHERVLDMNPMEWRDRRIFQHAGADSDRIEMRNGESKMALRREGRKWMMTEPVRTRVDAQNLDAFLQALGRATVADYILDVKDDKELANFGLAKPVVALSVITTPQSPAPAASNGTSASAPAATNSASITETLFVGQPRSAASLDRFGMIDGRPVVVSLSGPVLAALFRGPENLASPTGSGVNPADVKSLVIHTANEEFKLERDLDKWRAPGKDNVEVNPAQVQELLDQLCTLRAPSVELKAYPRDLELATVTFFGFNGKALDTVRIAQEKDKPATALENGDNVLRVFPQGLKMRLAAADFGV